MYNERSKPMNTADLAQLTAKGDTLRRGVLSTVDGDINEALRRMSNALAFLTCPSADYRNLAKRRVKQWQKAGEGISPAKQ